MKKITQGTGFIYEKMELMMNFGGVLLVETLVALD